MSSSDDNLKDSSDSPEQKPKQKKDHNKKFYEDHPEKRTEKITCPECGLNYHYSHKTQHYNSKKHRYMVMELELTKLKKQQKNTQCC